MNPKSPLSDVPSRSERDLFLAALQVPVEDRESWLENCCEGDVVLRNRVVLLLNKHEADDAFMGIDEPPLGIVAADDDAHGETLLPAADLTENRDKSVELELSTDFSLAGNASPVTLSAQILRDGNLPAAGMTIGHYRIQKLIGKGAMGLVLEAEDTRLKRTVAIKLMSPEVICNTTSRARFEREAQMAAAVQCEHIVTIHSVDHDGACPFLVMEYVRGRTLSEVIRDGDSLPFAEILRISKEVTLGLAAAHADGLIHRDIKPGNILIENESGRVKITDFGLARGVEDSSLTTEGHVVGTPQYMSPEQAQGDTIDHRSDLFSLGCVMYAMCTGQSPFKSAKVVSTLKRICFDQEEPVRSLAPEIPKWFAAIVHRLLSKDRDKRFQSAEDVLQEIESQQRQADAAATRPPLRRWAPRIAAAVVAMFGVVAIGDSSGVTDVSGFVLRFAKGYGTVEIRVHEPGVQVSVNGNEYTITSGDQLSITLSVPPGEQVVEMSKDGKPLKREIFTLNRFDERVLEMTYTPTPGQRVRGVPVSPVEIESDWSSPEQLELGFGDNAIVGRPEISADGLTLYFEAVREGDPLYTDLWRATRATLSESFADPQRLSAALNTQAREGNPTVTGDGRILFFSASYHRGGVGKTDLWQATRDSLDDLFSDPVNLGATINSEDGDSCPMVTADGLQLLFVSKGHGGYGEEDLWMATRTSLDEPFGEPENLGRPINTSARESSPFLMPDGLTIWFVSNRPGTFGERDLYYATRKSRDDAFDEPVNAGPMINSSYDEESPSLTADGQILVFESNRPTYLGGSEYEKLWLSKRIAD